MKLGELERWLQAEGFKQGTVRGLLRDGTIPRKHLPGRKRAYYEVAKVAEVMGLR